MKILLLIISIGLIYWIVKSQFLQAKPDNENQATGDESKKVVPCHHCNLHIPEKEAVLLNDQYYCCQEHAEQKQDIKKEK